MIENARTGEIVPAVYLHPIGLDRRFWTHILPTGALALDFPGFGDAPALKQLTMRSLVEYVLGYLSGPTTLVGLSLGGMVALQLAAQEPAVVASLVIACSTASSDALTMHRRATETRLRGMAGTVDATLERWFSDDAVSSDRQGGVAYARECLLHDDAEVVASYWEAMASHDVVNVLSGIGVPTTIVAGLNDSAAPVNSMRTMAALIPGASLEVLDGPHMLPLVHPDAFESAVRRHLKRAGITPRKLA